MFSGLKNQELINQSSFWKQIKEIKEWKKRISRNQKLMKLTNHKFLIPNSPEGKKMIKWTISQKRAKNECSVAMGNPKKIGSLYRRSKKNTKEKVRRWSPRPFFSVFSVIMRAEIF